MRLSIIILNYKVPYYLLNCLASVEKSIEDLEAEIIVVDNNSQDDSVGLVRCHFPKVKTIALRENLGFSKGNNKGVEKAKGEFICLLNPDTVVSENTFKEFLTFADKHTDFGALGPRLIDGGGAFLPESKRCIPTPKVALQKLMGFPEKYYAAIPSDADNPVSILVGAFMFMKQSKYREVGGLDEDYFMYGEDIDLSFSLLKSKAQNYYLGQHSVLHYKGESTVKDKHYRNLFYGAMQIFYDKHFKGNMLSESLVKAGLKIAKKRHKNDRNQGVTRSDADRVFYIGDSEPTLRKLDREFPGVQKRQKNELCDLSPKALVIFDAAYLNYAEILACMTAFNTSNFRFRIKPEKFNFIIGSDHNTRRGEVIHL